MEEIIKMNLPYKIAILILFAVFSLQPLTYAGNISIFENGTSKLAPEEFPERVELVEGQLYVTISKVKIGNKAIEYRYLSEGLYNLGHAEIFAVFVNSRDQVEELSSKVGSYLKMVHGDALTGKRLKSGDYTQFTTGNYFGWDGIVYTDSPRHLAHEFPRETLNMLVLSANEVEAVQEFGPLRILTMLGKEMSHYPNPYWSDLGRRELPISAMRSRSLASRIPTSLSWQGASATVSSETEMLRLRIDPDFFPDLPAGMTPEGSVRIMLSLADEADGCFTFSFDDPRNGLSAIMATNRRGQRLGCCMLLLAESEKYSAKLLEDGFVLLMPAKEWQGFWEAVRYKKNFRIESEKATTFVMEWR